MALCVKLAVVPPYAQKTTLTTTHWHIRAAKECTKKGTEVSVPFLSFYLIKGISQMRS